MSTNGTYELKVTVKYLWDNEPEQYLKDYAESKFMEIRNAWCQIVNPHYEQWNQEAEELGICCDCDNLDGLYMRYMVECTQELTDQYQDFYATCFGLIGYQVKVMITDECDFSLWFKSIFEERWHKLNYVLYEVK